MGLTTNEYTLRNFPRAWCLYNVECVLHCKTYLFIYFLFFSDTTMTSSKTFLLKEGLESVPLHERRYVDFASYLYNCKTVKQQQGRVLVLTNPAENGGHVISPGFSNGFVGALYQAYNEHRHLILRPDDVWTMCGSRSPQLSACSWV